MFKVYDHKGAMFEVHGDKATELMNKHGWTPWHPDNAPDAETLITPKKSRRKSKKAEAEVSEAPADDFDDDNSEQDELFDSTEE